MAELQRFKPITTEDTFKGVDKSYSAQQVASGSSLLWYMASRSSETWSTLADDMKHLFHSFGLAREDEDDWYRVFNVSDWYNCTDILIAAIPQSGVSSYIDGSTVRWNVPSATTAMYYTTFYGSTFQSYPDPTTNKQVSLDYHDAGFGGAYCYLFANTAGEHGLASPAYGSSPEHHPYTGNYDGAAHANADATSWHQAHELGTLTFDEAAVKMTPHLSATHWRNGDNGQDLAYGIALLDRGIFVLFDVIGRTDLLSTTFLSGETFWNADGASFRAIELDKGQNSDTTNRKIVYFTGTAAETSCKVLYRTVEQSYKNVYFCHCGQNEFNSTSNHTYNHKEAYFQPEEADSLWVSEIGLYDENDSLLAYAKLSEPVEKNKLETLTFKVELEL